MKTQNKILKEMNSGINIVCFDINSILEENEVNQSQNSEELMESPNTILNNFFYSHKLSNMEIKQLSDSELNYKFYLRLEEKTLFQIRIINNISFIHDIILKADSYIIIINLEDVNTKEKIKNIIRYILDSCCSVDIKTYIIGIYKNRILEECQKEKLENLFSEDNLNYDYFQAKYINNENEHFCLYEFIENQNYGNKIFFKKGIEEYKLKEIIEKITIETYEDKNGVIFEPSIRKFIEKSIKGLETSSCIIL